MALTSDQGKAQPAYAAQTGQRTFVETGKTVQGRFLEYWDANGGLAQQGFPISDEMQERSDTDGKTYKVQLRFHLATYNSSRFAKPSSNHPELPFVVIAAAIR